MNPKRLFEWQVVFWAIFVLSFAAAGAWMFRRLPVQPVVANQGPANSSDTRFLHDLQLKEGVKTVKECVSHLPPHSKVAVIFRQGTYQTLTGQLTCLAIWQQGHVPFEVSADRRETLVQLKAIEPVAICWLDGKPPEWLPEMKALAPSFATGPYRAGQP